MPLKKIDITTDHGTWVGDLFPVAFTKTNDNDEYLEQLAMDAATAAVQKTGDVMTGGLTWKLSANGAMLGVLNDGSGNPVLRGLNSAGNADGLLKMAGSLILGSAPAVRFDTNQLKVVGNNIPAGQYQGYILGSWNAKPGDNDDRIEMQYYRETADGSTSWSSFNWRIGRVVDATVQQFFEFHRAGRFDIVANSQRFQFQANGNATAPGSFVNGGSDPAIKDAESLRPITGATDALLGLNVRIGKYLPQYNADGLDRAFVMADDAMRQHTPQVIIEDVIDGQYAGWATDQLIAYLVAAHQEGLRREAAMQERIETMGIRLADLEAAAAVPPEKAP
ncbi:MAG: hypothetical protein BSK19_07475 [Stenotrophomonas maltophilia]|nr:MAG: hypothetical protein BSK19_07475 [Stenotrophomonas maltophilia]